METLIVNGVFGSGKTTVVEEMAEQMESLGLPFGAIDLDWLCWFFIPDLDDAAVDRTVAANLAAVVENYARAGVEYLLMAGTLADQSGIDALAAAIGFRPRVVRLVVPFADIEARLESAVTTGRLADLRRSREQLREGVGEVGDLEVANDRPVPLVARQILEWLGWI